MADQTDSSFRGDAIREALFSSCLTGAEGKKIILTSLSSKGMLLDSTHFYSLSEMQGHFTNLFGERISATIFEEVKRVLTNSAKWD